METYLLLVAPTANRVFAASAPALVGAELAVLAERVLERPLAERPEAVEVAGVTYLQVRTGEPDEGWRATLGLLSGVTAAYRTVGDLLEPVELVRPEVLSSDLVTIMKYPGKTNETFTTMLLNLTMAATARPARALSGGMTVMDPLAGRGTTLNVALSRGHDALGVETDGKDVAHYKLFLTTWLKAHHLKHRATAGSLTTNGKVRGRRLDVEFAADAAAYKAGQKQKLTFYATDTTDLTGVVAGSSVDVIVADTPYGVQHGSAQGGALRRSPLDLLDAALPGWLRILKPGGAIGLAYNRHVMPPARLEDLLHRHGLESTPHPWPDAFRHRVDASIDRDIVIATREKGTPHG